MPAKSDIPQAGGVGQGIGDVEGGNRTAVVRATSLCRSSCGRRVRSVARWLVEQIQEYLGRVPAMRGGDLPLHEFVRHQRHPFVARLTGLRFPRQRIIAIADWAVPLAVEVVARPAEIGIIGAVVSIAAWNISVAIIHPKSAE